MAGKTVQPTSRRLSALDLRVAGLSYTEISKQLGMTWSDVQSAVWATLDGSLSAPEGTVERLRALEATRLDAATRALWPRVLSGDEKAIAAFIAVSARRSRMLGLDAPPTVAVSVQVRGEMEAAFAALEARLAG